MNNFTKGKFNTTGINELDIDAVVNDWSELWAIYGNFSKPANPTYKIAKQSGKGEGTGYKTAISESQARELMEKCDLSMFSSSIFRTQYVFRKFEHQEAMNSGNTSDYAVEIRDKYGLTNKERELTQGLIDDALFAKDIIATLFTLKANPCPTCEGEFFIEPVYFE